MIVFDEIGMEIDTFSKKLEAFYKFIFAKMEILLIIQIDRQIDR